MKLMKNEKPIKKHFKKRILLITSLLLLLITLGCSQQPKDSDSGEEITITGNVVVKIQEPEPGSARQEVCDNAQTYNLCHDLNTRFSWDYKGSCCNKYDLCCGE